MHSCLGSILTAVPAKKRTLHTITNANCEPYHGCPADPKSDACGRRMLGAVKEEIPGRWDRSTVQQDISLILDAL